MDDIYQFIETFGQRLDETETVCIVDNLVKVTNKMLLNSLALVIRLRRDNHRT